MSQGEEALGGFYLKEGAWSSETECDGAGTSAGLFLLKTRPEQVSSSSEVVPSLLPSASNLQGVEQKGLGQRWQQEGHP